MSSGDFEQIKQFHQIDGLVIWYSGISEISGA
jgi:hypothetical protein